MDYIFNITDLELEGCKEWLNDNALHAWDIVQVQTIDGMSAEEWHEKEAKRQQLETDRMQKEAAEYPTHHITGDDERQALLATDSKEKVYVDVLAMPSTASIRLLNRVAIHRGLTNAGVNRNLDAQAARYWRMPEASYVLSMASKDDAIRFKLAMWKVPQGEAPVKNY